jgi:hypothetical protein
MNHLLNTNSRYGQEHFRSKSNNCFRGEFTHHSVYARVFQIKKGRLSSSLLVPRVGIEPTRPKTHDFESCASTSSAT